MLKAGLIGAAVGFFLAVVGAVVMGPICNPCAAMFVGTGAGVLAGVFVRPQSSGSGAGEGAKAGAIATVGNLLGQMVGTGISVLIVDPEQAAQAARDLAGQWGGVTVDPAIYARMYYPIQFGSGCLCGLVGVGLGAGLGAVGGLLWYQFWKQNEGVGGAGGVG